MKKVLLNILIIERALLEYQTYTHISTCRVQNLGILADGIFAELNLYTNI